MTAEVDRLEKIVRDFLAFARPAEPTPEIVRPSALLRATSELLAPEYEHSGYRLTLEIRDDATVKADPSQLRQVLLNLVRNAAESMPHGGPIILRSCVRPDDAGTGGAALASIEVEDRGPGIPAPVQARLFDPFFTTKEGGTGLGLSISARIVEAHGGRIECETKLNLGTVFRILLPISPNHAQSKQPDSAA